MRVRRHRQTFDFERVQGAGGVFFARQHRRIARRQKAVGLRRALVPCAGNAPVVELGGKRRAGGHRAAPAQHADTAALLDGVAHLLDMHRQGFGVGVVRKRRHDDVVVLARHFFQGSLHLGVLRAVRHGGGLQLQAAVARVGGQADFVADFALGFCRQGQRGTVGGGAHGQVGIIDRRLQLGGNIGCALSGGRRYTDGCAAGGNVHR